VVTASDQSVDCWHLIAASGPQAQEQLGLGNEHRASGIGINMYVYLICEYVRSLERVLQLPHITLPLGSIFWRS
jgi:hypothetical protein